MASKKGSKSKKGAKPKKPKPPVEAPKKKSEPPAEAPPKPPKAARNGGDPKPDPRKKETVVKQPPPMLLPAVAYAVFLAVCYVVGRFDLLSSTIVYPVFAVGSIAIVIYIVIAMRIDLLRSKIALGLVAAWAVLAILATLVPLKSAIFYSETQIEKRMTTGARTLDLSGLEPGKYMLFLQGHFTKLDSYVEEVKEVDAAREAAEQAEEEAEASEHAVEEKPEETPSQDAETETEPAAGPEEAAAEPEKSDAVAGEGGDPGEEEESDPTRLKQRTYDLEGTYTMVLRARGGDDLKTIDGRFTAAGAKRHLSKKRNSVVVTHRTTSKQVVRIPKGENVELALTFLDEELSKGIDVTVYRWSNIPLLNYLLAALAMVVGAFIDFLLKNRRQPGWFTFAAGLLAGFANYYLSEATPATPINIYVFDLVIGGVIGIVFAAGFLYGLDPLWQRLNRNWKINLN